MPQPSRSLNLEGASNFRDLGGYPAGEGRTVRWRRLFRSDHLAGLTPDDLKVVADVGLARALDFRGVQERAAASYDIPGVTSHSLAVEPTVVQSVRELLEAGHDVRGADAVRLMQQTYRGFVHDNARRFAEFFEHVLDDGEPLVFHCTAGKDRTGFAAAMLLTAMDVPRDIIVHDYLLTNEHYQRPPSAASSDVPLEVLQVLWKVQQEFLDAAFDALERERGGVGAYLVNELGVGERERQRLAQLYLER